MGAAARNIVKRAKRLTLLEIVRVQRIKGEVLWQLPLPRLARIADAIRSGKPLDDVDRTFIADQLDERYMQEKARKRDDRAAVADELARRARITRELAAAFVARKQAEVPAIVRAIGRLRKRKRRKRK